MSVENLKIAVCFAAMLLGGCTSTAKVNKFKAFAQTGTQYQNALLRATDVAIVSNIDSDSINLITVRKLTPDDTAQLTQNILKQNNLINETTAQYLAFKQQAALLGDYFNALGSLASYDGASGLVDSTQATLSAITTIAPKFTPSDFVPSIVPIGIANFQSSVLTSELERNAHVIDAQLQAQTEFLIELSETLKADRQIILNAAMTEQVVLPYGGSRALSNQWIDTRRRLILDSFDAGSAADEAIVLSKKMRTAFISLVEGRLEAEDLILVAEDLNRVTAVLEQIID